MSGFNLFKGSLSDWFRQWKDQPSESELRQVIEEDKKTDPMWIKLREWEAEKEQFGTEFQQMRYWMHYCHNLMKTFGFKLPHEYYSAWYHEDNSACLPIAIKPFIT